MNLTTLQYLIAVYEEKNMTKAAIKLFIAQPTLSQSIRTLEEELGVVLFDRNKTPLVATDAGEFVIQWARQLLTSEQYLRDRLNEISKKHKKPLTIGISTHKTQHLLPEAIRNYYFSPDCSPVILKESTSKELGYMLDRGTIDLLIDQPYKSSIMYESIPLTNERLLVAAPASFDFPTMTGGEFPEISVNALKDKPLIFQSGNDHFSEIVGNLFNRIGQAPTIALECQSPQTAHTLVSYGIGLTFISEVRLTTEKLSNVNYFSLQGIPLNRIVAVTYKKEYPPSESASRFIITMQKVCESFRA